MPRELLIQVSPEMANNEEMLYQHVSKLVHTSVSDLQKIVVVKRSIDARQKAIKFNLKLNVYFKDEVFTESKIELPNYPNVTNKQEVIVVGAGPAGLFAALQLIELGLKPIVLETASKKCCFKKKGSPWFIQAMINDANTTGFFMVEKLLRTCI